jgi:hypothetical protein
VISQDIFDHLLHIVVDPLPLLVGHADAETVAHRHVQLIDQPGRKPADHGASFALAAQLTSARTKHSSAPKLSSSVPHTPAVSVPALAECPPEDGGS